MVDETPRLDLDTFGQGDTNWDHTDTVEALDEHAICRGPIAERPAEGEYDDELYHATDQRITWRWDADEGDWLPAGGLGSASNPVPGTTYLEDVCVDRLEHEDMADNVGNVATVDASESDLSFLETVDVTETGGFGGDFEHYATDDDELDRALDRASDGDRIYLGKHDFSKDRTGYASIGARVEFVGTGGSMGPATASRITADWEFDSPAHLSTVYVRDCTVTFNAFLSTATNCTVAIGDAALVANADRVMFEGIHGSGTVRFESGTTDGVAGPLSGVTTATDRGDNQILGA